MTYNHKGFYAALKWRDIKKEQPDEGSTVLIFASYNGIETTDAAFYEGVRSDGTHWWVLGDVQIDQSSILFWAVIQPPELIRNQA